MSRFTPILMYHEVGNAGGDAAVASWTVSTEQFASHLEGLAAAGYTGISVSEWLRSRDGDTSSRRVVLTFDDGCAGNIENALPALVARGWTATFFVISGRMGVPGFARASDWAVTARAGMEVASHTRTHPFAGALSEAEALEELALSRLELEEACGGVVEGMSWPNGDAHPAWRRLLPAAGYRWACTSQAGFATPGTDALRLPRLAVRSWHEPGGLLALMDDSAGNRARLGLVWSAKSAARAMLGRRRYADIQRGLRSDG